MGNILCLTEAEKDIYDSILFAIKHGKTEFSVSSKTDMNQVSNLVKIVLAENSEYFYYDNCKINYSGFGTKRIVKLSKWLSSLSVRLYMDKFNTETKRIIDKVIKHDMSKMQKILAIHNYLVENVTYFGGITGIGRYQHYHTAYGAIVDKCAVCEGISAAFCYLLSLVGIKSSIINGSTQKARDYGHTWNIVEVDGKCYHFDVTWNLKNKDDSSFPCLDYFALKDSDLSRRSWNRNMYPLCNYDDMNFFQVTRSIANSDNELISIAKKQALKSNGLYIKCPYLSHFKTDEQYCDYISNLINKNYDLLSLMRGGVTFRINEEQMIICATKQ